MIPLFSLFVWVLYFGFPPPNFSDSLSFNAKSQFIKKNNFNQKLNVLAVGSSMTLNNINSNSIKRNFGKRYLNFSSWGQNIEEDYKLIKIFEKHLKPQTIILSSNIMDFNSNLKNIKYEKLESCLFERNQFPPMPSNLKVFSQNSINYHNYKQNSHIYSYLKFDCFGGVNFTSKDFKITKERWKGNSISKSIIDPAQYRFLDSIASLCDKRNIRFIFIQSPFREGWISHISRDEKEVLKNHIDKLQNILNNNQSIFINTQKRIWNDSLFVDYAHLNKEGSKKYTDLIIEKLKMLN